MVFDIKKFAIHDGPGIRTTVFLKGCPLDCSWCHNPEGKTREQEFMWWKERCEGCGSCQKTCTRNAISLSGDSLLIDQGKCDLCGACADACYSKVLKIVGKEMTTTELVKEIEKDIAFFDQSGGGVTVSGGEPLMQPSFLSSLLRACKELGIHRAVDTCGYAEPDMVSEISKNVDLFLYDLKVIDHEKHLKFTGVSNNLILENLKLLSSSRHELVVRFPLIPGVNDDTKDILELGTFVSSLENVAELTILPYHKAGVEKHRRLRKSKDLFFINDPPSAERLSEIQEMLGDFGLTIQIGG